MRPTTTRSVLLLLLATAVGCEGSMTPPPLLTVTSPQRSMTQGTARQIVVQGTAVPGPAGDPVLGVTVNKVPATLAADGSFSATVDLPPGAMLLETVAMAQGGGAATDARAVQVGELRPVGAGIERAVTAALSADAFARLSAAAGPLVKAMDLSALLAPLQPMANLGDSIANAQLSITRLAFGDVRIELTPVAGGLDVAVELDALSAAASVHYDGALIPEGTTTVAITADRVTIAGTLVVTPAGTAGFTTRLASPTVHTTNLVLAASGLVGQILDLLNANLASTIQDVTTRSAEAALEPLINAALGALAGPQRIDVLGKTLALQASPSAIAFTTAGALVTMNVQAKLAGSEVSPGYIFTPNGTPALDVGNGIQLGLADDLINELLAEVHALGLLDLHLHQDFGLFDDAEIKLTMPPMISASTGDGSMRLVLGDMIATFTDHGAPVISAAINAQVDLAILRGTSAQQVALQFGKVDLFVNVLDPASGVGGEELAGAASSGIGLQLDSLSQFLITVPVPAIAGVSLDNLALHTDSGYVVVSGDIH